MISLQYMAYVQRSRKYCSSQLLNVSSRLKSTQVDMPLSSQVESSRVGCAQVDRRRLGVILASSWVTFLYLSDSQV